MAKKNEKPEVVAASDDAVTTPKEAVAITDANAEAKAKEDAEAKAVKEKADAEAKAKEEAEAPLKKVNYKFTKDAPKSIRYGGKVYTQEEVLTNEDLLQELISGRCIFIKKI